MLVHLFYLLSEVMSLFSSPLPTADSHLSIYIRPFSMEIIYPLHTSVFKICSSFFLLATSGELWGVAAILFFFLSQMVWDRSFQLPLVFASISDKQSKQGDFSLSELWFYFAHAHADQKGKLRFPCGCLHVLLCVYSCKPESRSACMWVIAFYNHESRVMWFIYDVWCPLCVSVHFNTEWEWEKQTG